MTFFGDGEVARRRRARAERRRRRRRGDADADHDDDADAPRRRPPPDARPHAARVAVDHDGAAGRAGRSCRSCGGVLNLPFTDKLDSLGALARAGHRAEHELPHGARRCGSSRSSPIVVAVGRHRSSRYRGVRAAHRVDPERDRAAGVRPRLVHRRDVRQGGAAARARRRSTAWRGSIRSVIDGAVNGVGGRASSGSVTACGRCRAASSAATPWASRSAPSLLLALRGHEDGHLMGSLTPTSASSRRARLECNPLLIPA